MNIARSRQKTRIVEHCHKFSRTYVGTAIVYNILLSFDGLLYMPIVESIKEIQSMNPILYWEHTSIYDVCRQNTFREIYCHHARECPPVI